MKLLTDKTAALFDLGSTLIEYENIPWSVIYGICLKSAYEFLRTANFDVPPWEPFVGNFEQEAERVNQESLLTQREKNIHEFFREFLAQYGIRGEAEFEENFLQAYYKPIRDNLTLKDGAVEILEFFKSGGLKIGLVSNTIFPKAYHLQDMAHFKIDKYFDAMLFSCETEYRKPHPSIFNDMLAMLDISPSKAFFIGDRIEIDIAGAGNAGISAVLLRKPERDYRNLSSADLVINNLTELIEYY